MILVARRAFGLVNGVIVVVVVIRDGSWWRRKWLRIGCTGSSGGLDVVLVEETVLLVGLRAYQACRSTIAPPFVMDV